jgi:hypothetical protein
MRKGLIYYHPQQMKILNVFYCIILSVILSTTNAKKNLRKLVVYYPTGGENVKKDFTPYDNSY